MTKKEKFELSFETLINDRNNAKLELKDRKKWKTALINEYCKARTQQYECMKKKVVNMITTANIMVNHYEVIVKEYDEMIKELYKNFEM